MACRDADAVGGRRAGHPQEEAHHRLGAALVQRDEAIAAERSLRRAGRDAEDGEYRRLTREQPRAVLRRRLAVEREVSAGAEDTRIADEAVLRQARVRRERSSDVRAALDCLGVVDSALASMRKAEIERLVDSAPPYATGQSGRPGE
jgi:hypothetical protein